MKNQIIENNRMIAEFMGAKIEFNKLNLGCYWSDEFCPTYRGISLHDLNFHSSWDLLMPVVQKCTEIDHYQAYTHYKPIIAMLGTFDILNVFSAVIDCIKWYNENKI